MVSDASEHLRALVDGVLDIASNDAGTFVLGEPGDVDLYRLIQSAVGISRADTRKKNIVLTSFVDGGVPRIVQTWDQHLKAVLINTIGNAVKYTDTGSVFVAVRPLSYSDDGYVLIVRVEITDTGIGIPAEQLRTLCEPFASGDDSRNRRFEGTGLGLTITKQYLDEMRGGINILSEEGVSTTVELDISVSVALQSVEQQFEETLAAVVISAANYDPKLSAWLETNNVACERMEDSQGVTAQEVIIGDRLDVILSRNTWQPKWTILRTSLRPIMRTSRSCS